MFNPSRIFVLFAPVIIDTGLSNKAFRKSWARLIQKVYEVDSLLCPKCKGQMRIRANI